MTQTPDWEQTPVFGLLDSRDQDRLRGHFAEALILLTRDEMQRGGHSRDSVLAAQRWNELADLMFRNSVRPAVLVRQRAELEARLNGQPLPHFKASNVDAASDLDLYFDGLDHLGLYHYGEATANLTRFTERQPSHLRAWFARGYAHAMLGQADDSAAAFGVCLALRPDFPLAHFNRGLARYHQRRFPDAERDFTRALELKPNWGIALLNRGLARDELHKFAEAEADYTAALELPNAPTRLYFLRADARRELKNAMAEAKDRSDGMTREPTDPVSFATRGKRWMEANKPNEALADFDAALKLHPTMRDALLNKAIVLGDYLHREADAIPVLDRLLEVYPHHTDARAGRGVYFARLGRTAEAKKDAEATLRADQSAFRLYQMAGLYAQLSKVDPKEKETSIQLFARSLRAGFADWKIVDSDPDIAPIRNDPEFVRLKKAAVALDA